MRPAPAMLGSNFERTADPRKRPGAANAPRPLAQFSINLQSHNAPGTTPVIGKRAREGCLVRRDPHRTNTITAPTDTQDDDEDMDVGTDDDEPSPSVGAADLEATAQIPPAKKPKLNGNIAAFAPLTTTAAPPPSSPEMRSLAFASPVDRTTTSSSTSITSPGTLAGLASPPARPISSPLTLEGHSFLPARRTPSPWAKANSVQHAPASALLPSLTQLAIEAQGPPASALAVLTSSPVSLRSLTMRPDPETPVFDAMFTVGPGRGTVHQEWVARSAYTGLLEARDSERLESEVARQQERFRCEVARDKERSEWDAAQKLEKAKWEAVRINERLVWEAERAQMEKSAMEEKAKYVGRCNELLAEVNDANARDLAWGGKCDEAKSEGMKKAKEWEKEAKEAQEKAEGMKMEIRRLRKENAKRVKEVKALKKTLGDAMNENAQLKASLAEKEADGKKLRRGLQKRDEEIRKMKDEHDEEMDRGRKDILALREENATANTKISSLESRCSTVTTELGALLKLYNALKILFDALDVERTEAKEIDLVKSANRRWTNEVEALESKYSVRNEEDAKLTGGMARLCEENAALKNELDAQRREGDVLKAEAGRLMELWDGAEKENAQLLMDAKVLEEEHGALENENRGLKESSQSFVKEKKQMVEKEVGWQVERDRLGAALARLDADNTRLKTANIDLKRGTANLRGDNARLTGENKLFIQQQAKLGEDINALTAILSTEREEKANLEAKVRTLNDTMSHLETALSDMEEEKNRLEEQVEDLTASLAQLQDCQRPQAPSMATPPPSPRVSSRIPTSMRTSIIPSSNPASTKMSRAEIEAQLRELKERFQEQEERFRAQQGQDQSITSEVQVLRRVVQSMQALSPEMRPPSEPGDNAPPSRPLLERVEPRGGSRRDGAHWGRERRYCM